MRTKLFVLLACMGCFDAFAASPRDGRNVVNDNAYVQNDKQNQYRAGINVKNVSQQQYVPQPMPMVDTAAPVANVAVDVTDVEQPVAQPVLEQKTGAQLHIEKQRDICVRNNIGIGNTFVWAARNSNVDSYSTMIEDVNMPENNTCFVKVAINSMDSKISVSDIPTKYFEMGRVVTCGSWVDEEMLGKRILEAKKTARAWGVVGATVGSAAVGVGAMELFGNEMIGGAVQGQKVLGGQELIISQLKSLKKDNPTEYERVVRAIRDLEESCNDVAVWEGTEKPRDCDVTDNNFLGLIDKLD